MLLTESLWRDEAFSALMARHDPLQIITLTADDSTPFVFYELLHFWMGIFGNSEIAMRALTALFFLATAAIMYLIGRRKNLEAGLWLGALSLTQPLLLYYGFEVRAYSLLALLTALTIYFYLSQRKVLLAVSAAALLYTHLFGVWVVGILFIWSALKKSISWSLVAAGLAYLPWVPNYVTLSRLVQSFLPPPDLPDFFSKLGLIGSPILLVVLPYWKNVTRHKNFWLYLALWGVPILGTFIISQFKPFFLERYLIVAVPAELLLVGLVVGERFSRVVLGVALVAQIFVSWVTWNTPHKQPFRELAAAVKSQVRAGDVIINGTSLTYFESQYYGLEAKIYSPHGGVPYYVGKVLIPDTDIVTTVPVGTRYWVIELGEPGGTMGEPFPAILKTQEEFGRLKLSLYEAH